MSRGMLLWEATLTFATMMASGLGGTDIVPFKMAFLLALSVQALNAATIVYKTGQWSMGPQVPQPSPVQVVLPTHPPEAPLG
jgi:hypothetical protein